MNEIIKFYEIIEGYQHKCRMYEEIIDSLLAKLKVAEAQTWRDAAAESSCRREHGGKWEDFETYCLEMADAWEGEKETNHKRTHRIENGVWFGLYPEVNRGRVSEFLGQGGPAEDIKYLLSVIKELEKEIGELKK